MNFEVQGFVLFLCSERKGKRKRDEEEYQGKKQFSARIATVEEAKGDCQQGSQSSKAWDKLPIIIS